MTDLTFLTTETENDLFLNEVGNIATSENLDSIINRVKNKLRTIKGELQLNTPAGIPYFETILSRQSPDVTVWEGYLMQAAKEVEGVISINSIISKIADNMLSYKMEIITEYGTAIIED